MINHFTYSITTQEEGLTILEYLRRCKYSRHLIIHLKKTETGITLNGVWAHVQQILHDGDTLEINLVENQGSTHIVPTPIPFEIIFEDEHLMVVNKPSNTPIHPSMGNFENTLANGILYYFKEKQVDFVFRCINRLDRDTTGLLIIAKHLLSSSILSSMVQERKIHREYLALASGHIPIEGTINAPIARVDGSAISRCVNFQNGESAITHYRLIDSSKTLSLVALKLETGRTHQIRVHMKYLGHPLIGDYLYNPDYTLIKRQALHSYRLSFPHPITGQRMDFSTPLPEDMEHAFKNSH